MANSVSQVVDIASPPTTRRSVDLLPAIFRTDRNAKFLAGTLDQYIQPAQLERINGWVGSKNTPTFNPLTDTYLKSSTKLKDDYQVEPALVVQDESLEIQRAISYDDLLSQLAYEGTNISDLNKLLSPKFASYNPHIDWDKFVNFDQYYWMPFGPDTVTVAGQTNQTINSYTVSDTKDGNYFVFTPDGLTPTPTLTLFRGITYVFNIDSKKKFWIKTARVDGTEAPFRSVINNGISKGRLVFKVDQDTPERLFYVAEDNKINGAEIVIKSLVADSEINVNQIIGQPTYTSGNGVKFTNGLRITFGGRVFPEEYIGREYFVEGVGKAIRLVDVASLATPEVYVENIDTDFDATAFDDYPFDSSNQIPINPEYITSNRASVDRNPWARYNRWFHEDVISISAEYNNRPPVLPIENRAKRPIVEFEADLQLYNFGSVALKNVQHIDLLTTDAFSKIEGQLGYYVDGVELANGDRIIFTADKDPFVNSKVWRVDFVKINNEFRISLEEDIDSPPMVGHCVVVTKGTNNLGSNWWFDGSNWISAQNKTKINQFPLFEVFDASGNRYSDNKYYDSDFEGTKLFNYGVGTGTTDPILGFPLRYRNIADQAFYIFENYYMNDLARVINFNLTYYLPVSSGFLRQNFTVEDFAYVNVWEETVKFNIPVIQSTVTTEETESIEITAVDNSGYQNLTVTVLVDSNKIYENIDYRFYTDKSRKGVVFTKPVPADSHVVFKIYTDAKATNGYSEISPGWTNNPFNGPIKEFTLSELTDHVKSMAENHPEFTGQVLGKNNGRDLPNMTKYGSRLIRNINPLNFAGYFLSNSTVNLLDATRKVCQDYNSFKLAFINQATNLKGNYEPEAAVDIILKNLNESKDLTSPYFYTDMLAYGSDLISRDFTVTDPRNTEYGLDSIFTPSFDNSRTVYVYHTKKSTGQKTHLLINRDYTFDQVQATVIINIALAEGDIITVKDYRSSDGSYVPPTPTKLGLYPKFEPSISKDTTYVDTQNVIQGHDGSVMIAFDDYRDAIILELEKRIYNNLTIEYNTDLIDLVDIIPGRNRSTGWGRAQINNFLRPEFLRWNSFFGFDYEKNTTVSDDPKSWNFKSAVDTTSFIPMLGGQRGIWKFYLDTDRPHSHPWEMLGFTVKPLWWEEIYGPAPYTRGNELLWDDLEVGLVRDPDHRRILKKYARPGLSNYIPVDDNGNLIDPSSAGLAQKLNANLLGDNWEFGDQAPVETAWRRSSYYPFAVQILQMLTSPASYFSLLFDTARIGKNLAGQYVNSVTQDFVKLNDLLIYNDVVGGSVVRSAGWSVMLVEAGLQKDSTFITNLKTDLKNLSMKLVNKLEGFVSKDKLEITIDSVNPATTNPGVTISKEDYELIINRSNPIITATASGVIIQRTEEGYILRGYDKANPYFNCYLPIITAKDPVLTVGGKPQPFITWEASLPNDSLLNDVELTTAVTGNTGYKFYKEGTIVKFKDDFYMVKVSHRGDQNFVAKYHQKLPGLPRLGGATVYKPTKYESSITFVPYGRTFATIQDVYNVLLGYGKYLESIGFIFDSYNDDYLEIINWQFSGKEFLYWANQGWSANSVITISPFANGLKYKNTTSMVDDLTSPFYEYSLLKADGLPLDSNFINVRRQDGVFTIDVVNTSEGLFCIKLNCVQKEHAVVLNNQSLFNDIIYDVESGYSQKRLKLRGLKTSNWNGDVYSPGFIYDEAKIADWQKYKNYAPGDVVRFSGNYYSAQKPIEATTEFDFTNWLVLGSKPVAQLLPNFDYKIDQFRDFYSLDIDNFDISQQKLAQHLVGYTSRPYLENVFVNPISQYKFYQGFIKEKGTKNTVSKLSKASSQTLGTTVDYFEEWAFRVGEFGSYTTNETLEFALDESKFIENPQIINFVESIPEVRPNETIVYQTPDKILQKPKGYSNSPFQTTSSAYDEVFQFPIAGYARLDDVDITAFNTNSLLDVANSRLLNDGSIIWVGFTDNGDWNMLRHTLLPAKVTNIEIYISQQFVDVTTDSDHYLNAGDFVNITQFDAQINGISQVVSVSSNRKFRVASTLDSVQPTFSPGVGIMFKFIPVRFNSLDDIYSWPFLDRINNGEKLWVDNDANNKWSVITRQDPYTTEKFNPGTTGYNITAEKFASNVLANTDGTKIFASSPDYNNSTYVKGRLLVLRKDSTGTSNISVANTLLLNNSDTSKFYLNSGSAGFGSSLMWNDKFSLLAVGAPDATRINFHTATNYQFSESIVNLNTSTLVTAGLVKFFYLDAETSELITEFAMASPSPQTGSRFGASLLMKNLENNLQLFVGAPGNNTGEGRVFYSTFAPITTTATIYLNTVTTGVVTNQLMPTLESITAGDNFGTSIAGADNSKLIAVSAPNHNSGYGAVFVFTSSNNVSYTNTQVISSLDAGQIYPGQGFGKKVLMSDDGHYLFVTAPDCTSTDDKEGKVFVFELQGQNYVLSQSLECPHVFSGGKFGTDIALSANSSKLIVTSSGNSQYNDPLPNTTFDQYSERLHPTTYDLGLKYINDSESQKNDSSTTFDGNATRYYSTVTSGNGSVFAFEKLGTKFVYAQSLENKQLLDNELFGTSVSVSSNCVFVGAPSTSTGSMYVFDHIEPTWNTIRNQPELVILDRIKKLNLIDTEEQQVVESVDILDPVKGKIHGLADQCLKYKTAFDPAVYSIGLPGVSIDPNTNWLDEHLGELWWDISSLKYVWYEQGDLEFRRNNWMHTFPGCTIDVYEWVGSERLPTEWATLADTIEGLATGISGQPKYPNNNVISVKQVYNPNSQSFTNVYYYWVKNKITIPAQVNRTLTAFDVASLIADPRAQGIKYAAPIAGNGLMLTNLATSAVGTCINANIEIDTIDNDINKHTEWVLLQEGNPESEPTELIKKKIKDSLLGRDSLGNTVPDPALPDRFRYGMSVRPRQSLFRDRAEALRELVEYSNTVLKSINLTASFDITSFNLVENYDDESLGTYDVAVTDIAERDFSVETKKLKQASMNAVIQYGRLSEVQIVDPGLGYGKLYPVEFDIDENPVLWVGPSTIIQGTGEGAKIQTYVDTLGKIVKVELLSQGKNYTETPYIIVRPFTVLVKADETIANRWSYYAWDYAEKVYNRIRSQSYKTTDYWSYIDWQDSSYDHAKDLARTIDAPYQLDILRTVARGSYVKINNAGDGRYVILRKTAGTGGTWNKDYDLIYQEKGSIQLSDNLWMDVFGFDFNIGFDQLLYDQKPNFETENILDGLESIFSNEYKIYSNQLFFKLIKYAHKEQKFLDWAFKTSFISVTNKGASLDQPATYRLNNESYYESYLNETKPYHTKIRTFETNYTSTDLTSSIITDFDIPATYNTGTSKYSPTLLGNSLMNDYPWKSWYDNYKFYVDSIEIYDGGSGYQVPPQVVFTPAAGDTGSGAKAEAYIALGKVTKIIVTDPGSGYTQTPIVTLLGGGNTAAIPAKLGVRMTNGKIRTNTITLKFDRVAGYNEIDTKEAEDVFTADGSLKEYQLTWAPRPEKTLITVKVNGIKLLPDAYSVKTFTAKHNGYTKKYGKIVLAEVPDKFDEVRVIYDKDTSLYHAVDRIRDYYAPTSGMPGNSATMLMAGLEYPGVTIDTLPLYGSMGFDSTPFGATNWDDYIPEPSLYQYPGHATTSLYTLTFIPSTLNTFTVYIDNIRWTGTAALSTSSVLRLVNGVVTGNGSANRIDIGTTVSNTSVVSFRDINSDGSQPIVDIDLDTYISGGEGFTQVFKQGVADDPAPDYDQIALDGDKLVSDYNSYGPEENLPGKVSEALGINVYTQPASGSALSVVRNYYISSPTTRFALGMTPANVDSVEVIYNNTIVNNFTIDWSKQEIVLASSVSSGHLTVKTLGLAGVDTLDRKLLTISTATGTKTFEFTPLLKEVKDCYVTVNGVKKVKGIDFLLKGKLKGGTAGRAVIQFESDLPIGTILQVWLFGAEFKAYSEVRSQTISSTPGVRAWTLTYMPGTIEPYHSQVIVEKDGLRLLPPDTLYFQADGQTTSFSLNTHKEYAPGRPSGRDIEVYVNGVRQQFGYDFELVQNENRINFNNGVLESGDVVAISILLDHQYYITNGKLFFTNDVDVTGYSNIRVYSFNNHDSSLIHKERFQGGNGNWFYLDRVILGIEYVWVELNGVPLMRNRDYTVENNSAIVLDDHYHLTENDYVVITSVNNVVDTDSVLGYRVFYDNLGRTHYKRLSAENTTRLAVTLTSTATTITVQDATVLTKPNFDRMKPGIILVNGERIQFYEINGNILSKLKRGTLGTGVPAKHNAGTNVIDQGSGQTMNLNQRETVWRTRATGTNSFQVSTVVWNDNTSSHYQSEVYYRGKLLRRPGVVFTTTDLTIGYDSNETGLPNTLGSETNVVLGGEYTLSNTGTLILAFTPVPGAEIKVVKRSVASIFNEIQEFAYTENGTTVTNTRSIGKNLMQADNSEHIKFLLRKPAQLPDKYYYGNK